VNHKTLMFFGMLALLVANTIPVVQRLWLHSMGVDLLDGLRGLCYGVAIGLLILSVRRKMRQQSHG